MRNSDAILSTPARNNMMDGRLGWNPGSNTAKSNALGVWWHGGDGYFPATEIHTCVMTGPQKLSLALLMNSQRPTGNTQCGVLLNALNEARSA